MKLFNAIATAAIIGSSLIATSPAEAFWWGNNDEKRRSEATLINQQQLVYDYQKNSVRFRKNWVGPVGEQLFLKASGYVRGDVEGWGFTFKTPSKVTLKNGKQADLIIQCSNLDAKGKQARKFDDDISALDDGDYVKATFNLEYNNYAEISESRVHTWVWLNTKNCMVEG
jgi:hypothetical protein